MDEDKLKLIYILKIGYNTNDEGLYEFVFSIDPTNIDVEGWCWDLCPACDNAMPPTSDFVNGVFSLKSSTLEFYCLHEAVDREYMHGYHTIHALAYEIEKEPDGSFSDYESMFENDNDELPLLVFHYGMSLKKIKDLLSSRKIILKNKEFIETSSIKL